VSGRSSGCPDVLAQPTPYPGGLTWVRRPEDTLAGEARDLLAAARAAGVEPVHEVGASGMMELMAEIERSVDLPPAAAAHLAVHRPAPLRYPAPPPAQGGAGPGPDQPDLERGAGFHPARVVIGIEGLQISLADANDNLTGLRPSPD
jgi:hypothetical protein